MTNQAHHRRTVLEDLRTERDNLVAELDTTLKLMQKYKERLDLVLKAIKALDALAAPPSQGSPSRRDDAPSLDGAREADERVLYGYYDREGDIIVVDPDNHENTVGYVLCFQATEDDDIGEFEEWSSGPSVPLSELSIELSRPVYVNKHAAR